MKQRPWAPMLPGQFQLGAASHFKKFFKLMDIDKDRVNNRGRS